MSETHEQYQARLLAEFKRVMALPVGSPGARMETAHAIVSMLEQERVEALTNVDGDGI